MSMNELRLQNGIGTVTDFDAILGRKQGCRPAKIFANATATFDRASLGKQKIVTSYDNIDFGVDY